MATSPRGLSCRTVRFFLALACCGAGTGQAATATTTLAVTATVTSACTVAAAPLAFGNYQASSSSAVTANTTLTVTCNLGTPYNVGLDAGSASGATVSTRAMTLAGGSSTLSYGMYSNSLLTTNWGNTAGTDAEAGTGTGIAQTLTVYGKIPAAQSPTTGAYADTVTVTVYY